MNKYAHLKLLIRGNSDLSWKENDSKKINIKGIRRSLKKRFEKEVWLACWRWADFPDTENSMGKTSSAKGNKINGLPSKEKWKWELCFQQDWCHCCSHKICASILQHLFSECHISARMGTARMCKNLSVHICIFHGLLVLVQLEADVWKFGPE